MAFPKAAVLEESPAHLAERAIHVHKVVKYVISISCYPLRTGPMQVTVELPDEIARRLA
jgi:phospholipid N-methyltransferase